MDLASLDLGLKVRERWTRKTARIVVVSVTMSFNVNLKERSRQFLEAAGGIPVVEGGQHHDKGLLP